MTADFADDPVVQLAREAEQYDGVAPFDEATLRAVERHPDRVRTFVEDDGCAVLTRAPQGLELGVVVRPVARRRGIGAALVRRALSDAGNDTVHAWSHGNHPGAAALAARFGFEKVRELWVMRRPGRVEVDVPTLPSDYELRSYQESDADEVVRVNAAAFAAHPEQGAMDAGELAERMADAWFDPAGLLVVAGPDGRLAGFHWTKQHSPELGEVYVIGVDPSAQGLGLGKTLLLAGLRHLAQQGVDEVLLYVESDNAPAIALYEKYGFTHAPSDTHTQYARA